MRVVSNKRSLLTIAASAAALISFSQAKADEMLVKLASPVSAKYSMKMMQSRGLKTQALTESWVLVSGPAKATQMLTMMESTGIVASQPNYKIHLLENPSLTRAQQFAKERKAPRSSGAAIKDNPEIQPAPSQTTSGADPLLNKQWGMNDIGITEAIQKATGKKMIVAVIDTGVNYNHEDLIENMWRNPREIPNNGIDDDNNGYIDDVVGWDFASNDNKPFDLYTDPSQLLFGGGNPGHGTHCAGNVAARGHNGKGITGVAPETQIMALRFISEKGEGTTADAIKAIKYAVDNGAQITSNSWGSEGEDSAEQQENKALRDIIQYAQDKGVLFVAAAGNGHNGKGYNNDTDAKPGYPASYDHDNIISVAALDVKNQLGSFSNWGPRTVDIGAPGVNVFSTTADGKYNDKVIDLGSFSVSWDGTSMACPHVAGAAALYWSAHPEKTWRDVKDAILASAKRIPSLDGKVTSNGKLDLVELMKH